MFFDAHCHLQDPRLAPYLPRILEDLRALNVRELVVNGTREEDWTSVLELASQHEIIIPSLGLHPWYVKDRSPEWLSSLARYECAIGEIGLDRWIEGYDSPLQEEIFLAQLRLAAERNRPVSIHCLRAWGRLLEILSSEPLPRAGFLLHSYSGPAEMITRFADLGGYFSFSGYFAQPRKAKQLEVFGKVPRDRLLIETDAPDMRLPAELEEFHLGELNHPANIRAIHRFVERTLKVTPEIIHANFTRLFRGS